MVKREKGIGFETAQDIYDAYTSLIESTAWNWTCVRPLLIDVKEYFKKKGKNGIASYINLIILKESEVESGDWDSIRFLLHREIDETQPEPTEFLEMIKKKYGSL